MDLCIYITAINLHHQKDFPQFIFPEIKLMYTGFPIAAQQRSVGS